MCSVFEADEKKFCYETNQHPNVMVVGSTIGKHDHGSSKVKLKSIVDYKWDLRHYPGRLITVHIDGKHIAYAILSAYSETANSQLSPRLTTSHLHSSTQCVPTRAWCASSIPATAIAP